MLTEKFEKLKQTVVYEIHGVTAEVNAQMLTKAEWIIQERLKEI